MRRHPPELQLPEQRRRRRARPVTEPPTAPPSAGLHPTLAHNLVATLGWTTLRPLQRDAIEPVLRGDDALLLAPTAGGKTEAAAFPMLTRMSAEGWTGLSVLYLCPLKALLNNLLPRLETYGGWTGRRVALWHGDTPASARRSWPVHRTCYSPRRSRLSRCWSASASTTSGCSQGSGPSSWTRCTRSASVTEAGTCSPSLNGCPGSPDGRCSGSGCRRPSATRMSCCAGCKGRRPGSEPVGGRETHGPFDGKVSSN